jgi:hydrogenase expression/formation protein HypC
MDGQNQGGITGAGGTAPHCDDEICITCSDRAVPSRVVELVEGELARVDTGQSVELVSVALVDAAPGDTVLVHAGEAIAVVAGAGI